MTSELGLLFYFSQGTVHRMGVKPITLEEARKYIASKVFTHNLEERGEGQAAPPAYFVPLYSFNPLEATLAEALKEDDFKEPSPFEGLMKHDCEDDDCPIHGSSEEAMEGREKMKNSPGGAFVLRSLGLID